jgi:hypothetical protein
MINESRLEQDYRPGWWQVIAYLAAILPFLFLIASLWIRPDFKWQETPDWKPVLALAEASQRKGDLYEARTLYSRAGRLASWREDWQGLLAVACGMEKLDRRVDSYFNTHTILVRAMMAAESRQSRIGISAVAKAFTAIGEEKAASMVLSRVQTGWPEEAQDSPDVDVGNCLGA